MIFSLFYPMLWLLIYFTSCKTPQKKVSSEHCLREKRYQVSQSVARLAIFNQYFTWTDFPFCFDNLSPSPPLSLFPISMSRLSLLFPPGSVWLWEEGGGGRRRGEGKTVVERNASNKLDSYAKGTCILLLSR